MKGSFDELFQLNMETQKEINKEQRTYYQAYKKKPKLNKIRKSKKKIRNSLPNSVPHNQKIIFNLIRFMR